MKAIAAAACLVMVAGCGSDKEYGEYPGELYEVDEAKQVEVARGAQVRCAWNQDCHPSVALVTAIRPKGISVCTAFLISEKLAVTNRHCLPTKIAQVGADCGNELWLHFASEFGGTRTYDCRKVRSLGQPPGENVAYAMDWAVIELRDSVKRKTIKLSREKLPPTVEVVSAFRDSESRMKRQGRISAEIRGQKCQTVKKSLLIPNFDSWRSAVHLYGDCHVIGGNSGSPVLSGKQKAVAVLHAKLKDTTVDFLETRLASVLSEGRIAAMGFAVSAACVTTRPGQKAPAFCDQFAPGDTRHYDGKKLNRFLQIVKEPQLTQ